MTRLASIFTVDPRVGPIKSYRCRAMPVWENFVNVIVRRFSRISGLYTLHNTTHDGGRLMLYLEKLKKFPFNFF